ncbi:hypothetical protein [Kitasatospora sp. NPDC005751]|uniref:hypothetical protein n=1 Tax=Kitasatospora sp. NPDC005751 TaxID=3157064 RepID=UPI0033EB3C59
MGLINKAKGSSAGREAAQAYADGAAIFMYKAIEANIKSMTTGSMPGMAEQIQSIEAAGWILHHMAVGEGKALGGERIAVVMLFRRA